MQLKKSYNKIIILSAAALLLLASCNTKSCRCYLLTQWGSVVIEETYIDHNTDCSKLGYNTMNPYDSSYRYCTDIDAPEIDTMEIVQRFWGNNN